MKPLIIVITIIAWMITDTNEQPTEDQNKIIFDNAKGFEVNKSNLNFKAFIEEKLIEHTQALELLVNKLQKQEDIIKQLVDNLSNKIDPPKMPEKVAIKYTRRSNNEEQPVSSTDLNEVSHRNEDQQVDSNKWCKLAMLCQNNSIVVCGFDQDFGYGKFNGICHMFRVNCFWKRNFVLTPTCKPTFVEVNEHNLTARNKTQ